MKKIVPKVSVIVPVYNVEKYIKRCLDSLVNQTIDSIEIIIINDGSTDESKKTIELYAENFPHIIRYYEKKNGGLSDARNYGIPYATGEYIAFLDSDDYVELDMYEKMYSKAKEQDYDMVECDFFWEYPNKKVIDRRIPYKGKKEMMTFARVVAWNKLIKKTVIDTAKVQYPKGLRYEDVAFFYKMIPYYDKVSFVSEPLVHYVQRKDSISNVQNERTKEIFEVLDIVLNYYKDKNLYEEYKEELEYTYTRLLLCSSLVRIVKVRDKSIRKQLQKDTWNLLNTKFPEWKQNRILRTIKSNKNRYMKTVNKFTYYIYCFYFRILK